MAKIVQLAENVSNMIAAGEVVLGPQSVVKELVENALDAKATMIQINLLDAGLQQIEIVDNGSGMDETDAIMAFNRHATSKIRNAYDLASITTLGFRGEALPSIASVSKLELYTKEADKNYGTKVVLKDGKLLSKETAATNKGTRIVVSQLFYNTPARLKYLKSPSVILANICELLDKLALANPFIRFQLSNNNQLLLNTDGKGNIYNLIANIYGNSVAKAMHQNHGSYDGMELTATFSSPTLTRSRKNDITLIVNGRYVKSILINNSVVEAYKNYVPPLRYPVCILDLKIDSLLIDVNVHPQKTEIKFSLEKEVSELVKSVLQEGLQKLQIIPEVETVEAKAKPTPINFDEYVDFRAPSLADSSEPFQYQETVSVASQTVICQEKAPAFSYEAKSVTEEEPTNHNKLPYMEYIGQLAGTYLLFQNEEGLILVDQHAAQERINYEYYAQKLADSKPDSMPLLIPLNFEFTKEEAILLADNLDALKQMGLVLEPSGINSFFIREIPNWIKSDNPDAVIEKMLYYLLEKKNFEIINLRDSLAKQMACKASIKANQFVDRTAALALLNDLSKCQNPFNCPHGRPVFVKFSLYEIEKMFKRVM